MVMVMEDEENGRSPVTSNYMRESSSLSITIQYAITIMSPESDETLLFYAYPHFHRANGQPLTLAPLTGHNPGYTDSTCLRTLSTSFSMSRISTMTLASSAT